MATGIVSWINPPENKGKITRTDDGSNATFEYAINTGSTLDGFIPKMGDIVIFIPGNGNNATGIKKQVPEQLGIVSFTMGPDYVLSWETTGATTAGINNGIGDISDKLPRGSVNAPPTREPYILTVYNNSESLTQTASNLL